MCTKPWANEMLMSARKKLTFKEERVRRDFIVFHLGINYEFVSNAQFIFKCKMCDYINKCISSHLNIDLNIL